MEKLKLDFEYIVINLNGVYADRKGDQTPEQAPAYARNGRTTKFPAYSQKSDCG